MGQEVLSPRVEQNGAADLDAETLACEFRKRLGRRFEEEVVEHLPVL